MLASEFLKKLKQISKEDLIEVKGIGDVLADNFQNFLDSNRYFKLVDKFQELEINGKGLEIQDSKLKTNLKDQILAGEVICITGSFPTPRPKIKKMLEEFGAKTTDSVSSKTTILLAGESAGSKLQKAQSLGIKIVQDITQILPDNNQIL